MDRDSIYECLEQPLSHTESTFLFPFQRDNLDRMLEIEETIKKGMLCDEMGLGKTIQLLELIKLNRYGPTLIITPKHLLQQWKNEIEMYFPFLSFCDYNKDSEDFEVDIVFAIYQTITKEYYYSIEDNQRTRRFNRKYERPTCNFLKAKWYRVIIDEGQQVDNTYSKLSQMCAKIDATCRFFCTGTPFGDNLKRDLLGISTYLQLPNPVFEQQAIIDFLKPIFIRHNKSTVFHQLHIPNQQVIHHFLDSSILEREIYDRELATFRLEFSSIKETLSNITAKSNLSQKQKSLLSQLTVVFKRLRKLCSSPMYITLEPVQTEKSLLDTLFFATVFDYFKICFDLFSNQLLVARIKEYNADHASNNTQISTAISFITTNAHNVTHMLKQLQRLTNSTVSRIDVNSLFHINTTTSEYPVFITTNHVAVNTIPKLENVIIQLFQYLHHFLFIKGLTYNHLNNTEDNEYLQSTQLIRDYCLNAKLRGLNKMQQNMKEEMKFTPLVLAFNDRMAFPLIIAIHIQDLKALFNFINKGQQIINKSLKQLASLLLTSVTELEHDGTTIYEKNAEIQAELAVYFEIIQFLIIYLSWLINGQILVEQSVDVETKEHKLYKQLVAEINDKLCPVDHLYDIHSLQHYIHKIRQSEEVGDYKQCHDHFQRSLKDGQRVLKEIKEFVQLGDVLMESRYSYFLQMQHFSDGVQEIDEESRRDINGINNKINHLTLKSTFVSRKLVFLNSQIKDYESQFTCAICLEMSNDGVMLKCGHKFMSACFYGWFNNHRNCPTCRLKVNRDEVHAFAMSINRVENGNANAPLTLNPEINNLTLISKTPSTKINYIIKMVQYYENAKILIYSGFDSILYEIQRNLMDNNVVGVLAEQLGNIEKFKTNLDIRVLLLHTRTENSGLSLQCANHIIFVEPFSENKIQQQAKARISRIGQEKPTFIHYVCMKNTFEEIIVKNESRGQLEKTRKIGHDLDLKDVLDILESE